MAESTHAQHNTQLSLEGIRSERKADENIRCEKRRNTEHHKYSLIIREQISQPVFSYSELYSWVFVAIHENCWLSCQLPGCCYRTAPPVPEQPPGSLWSTCISCSAQTISVYQWIWKLTLRHAVENCLRGRYHRFHCRLHCHRPCRHHDSYHSLIHFRSIHLQPSIGVFSQFDVPKKKEKKRKWKESCRQDEKQRETDVRAERE